MIVCLTSDRSIFNTSLIDFLGNVNITIGKRFSGQQNPVVAPYMSFPVRPVR